MPRRIRDPESRHRVIAAAWRLVAVQGIHATTVRGIAAEAGVTTGSVTHYFEDKAEVMAAVLRYNNKLAAERVAAAVGGRTGLDALSRGVEAMLPHDEHRLRWWTVWMAFWGERGAHRMVAEEGANAGYGALEIWLHHAFESAVATGELPSTVDPRYESERVLVLVGGLGLMSGGEARLLREVRRRSRRMLAEHWANLASSPIHG
ncbi:TetR/AcrR family transcriptional regulator [Amycolatopsis sp. CA-230715]|uniref:TetR/AcrR family transcriptional regulator n=1 Tax=Amycolatopsis sp. CA-230715 TaxID=2745196 RepID=UPI001C0248DA|nr:TetR/AcrR family transcriptional regulator [Amycolatopsis sp. CA-230715]QWF83871.1 HTH-type transcriptional regulator BetI [Amycolatopsis sp. CA-230715]